MQEIVLKLPQYNKDRLFYTPSFIISGEPANSKNHYQRFMSVLTRAAKELPEPIIVCLMLFSTSRGGSVGTISVVFVGKPLMNI